MQYDKEFKLQALELSDEIGVKAAAEQLGIICRAVQCCEAFKTEVSLSLYTVIAPSGTTRYYCSC